MFFGFIRMVFSRRVAVVSFVLAVLMASELEGVPEPVRVVRGKMFGVVGVGRSILAWLFGEDTILSVEKFHTEVLGEVAGWVADNLNAILLHMSQFLQTNGVEAGLPIDTVSPERLLTTAQWLFKVLAYSYFIFEFFHLVQAMKGLPKVLLAWLIPNPKQMIEKKMKDLKKLKFVK